MRKIVKSNITLLVITLLLCIPAIIPYFHKGYFPSHDGEWAVVRLTDMFRSLKDLQFPVRYSGNLNFGYGYPLFNFVYPFPYYLGVLIHSVGVGFVTSIKFLFASSVVVSAIGMFFFSKELWGKNIAGFLSSILYVYFPYRFVDLYVRGSLGESLSLALFPFLFLLILKLAKTKKTMPFLILGGVVFAILIMTHNIMAVLFTPLLLLFCIFQWYENKKKESVKYFLVPIIGLLLSAFFWIPALLEKKNILLSMIPIADRDLYFVTLKQLIFPSWGYGSPTESNGFSYQLGIAHILVAITSLLLFFLLKRHSEARKTTRRFILLYVLFIGMACMLFRFTAIIWESFPFLSEINYPWTFLALLGFVLSLLSGFLAYNRAFSFIGLGIVILAIIVTLPYAKPKMYINKGDDFYLTNDATTTSSSELMPLWVKSFPINRPAEKVELLSGKGTIQTFIINSKEVSFTTNLQTSGKIRINTIYYPGWRVLNNGKEQNFSYANNKGAMDITLLKGKYSIQAVFSETPLRKIANTISLSTLVSLIIIFLWQIQSSIKVLKKV